MARGPATTQAQVGTTHRCPPGGRGLCSQADGGPGHTSVTPAAGDSCCSWPPAQHLVPAGVSQVDHGPGGWSQAPPSPASHSSGRRCSQHFSSLPWAESLAEEELLNETGSSGGLSLPHHHCGRGWAVQTGSEGAVAGPPKPKTQDGLGPGSPHSPQDWGHWRRAGFPYVGDG